MKRIFNPLFRHIGNVCYLFAVIQLLPLTYSLVIREPITESYGYLGSILLSIVVGALFVFLGRSNDNKENRGHGYVSAALAAIVIVIIASAPYIANGDLSFDKAIFEAASGLSTTGITTYTDVSLLPKSLLLYRGLTQWFGGALFIAYFMMVGFKSEDQIMLGYSSALMNLKLPKKINNVYKGVITFIALYGVLTVIQTSIMFALGLPVFEAFTNTLSIVSTGGFATHANGLEGVFNQQGIPMSSVQFVLSGLMIISGLGYYAFLRLANKDFKGFYQDTEMRTFGLFILTGVVVTFGVLISKGLIVADSFSDVVFWVTSSLATYGVYNHAFMYIPEMVMIALVLGAVGGMMGSVSSGIKVYRTKILAKSVGYEVDQIFKPSHELTLMKLNGKTINTRIILKLSIFMLAWAIIAIVGVFLIILVSNLDGSTAFASVIGAMANGGVINPEFLSYNNLNGSALYVYSLLMIIGRLEIIPFLVMFRRSAWK